MMRVLMILLAGLALATTPAVAQNTGDDPQLIARLRACLQSGSAGAPRDSLTSAVVAVRSLCYTQISRVRDHRLDALNASFGLPGARLTASQQDELDRARILATRQLNNEIAAAISTFTGLTA